MNRKAYRTYPPLIRAERYVRALLLPSIQRVIDSVEHRSFIHSLVKELIKLSADKSFNRAMAMPNSPPHKMKVRLWTVLIICSPSIDTFDSMFYRI